MGGISLPAFSSTLITGAGAIVVYAESAKEKAALAGRLNSALGVVNGLDTQFRPPQWSQPAMVMLTVPAAYVTSQGSSTPAPGAVTQSTATPANAVPLMLVFDGVMRASHSQHARATEHPIQDGANYSDHIVLEPAHLTLDILMTDVLPDYAPGGNPSWVGNASKSVACFQTIDNLRSARVPLTVTTRLKTYQNMFIVDFTPDETVKYRYGLRGTLELRQLNLFTVATATVSARNQTTTSTTIGQTAITPVPAGVTSQNEVPTLSQDSINAILQGAGNWSSNNVGGGI
jgi:hypothetical protein